MSMLIAGIGTAVPPHRISQVDAAEIAKQYSCETAAQERLFQTLYRRAGVDGRNCVVLNKSDGPLDGRQSFYTSSDPTTLDRMRKYEEQAGSLAFAACKAALQDAAIAPGHMTHLVTVSCSGFYAPVSTSVWSSNYPCPARWLVHISASWAARGLNGLRVARAFLDADSSACVLLCASNSAACTSSTDGMATRSWPMHFSPTEPPQSLPLTMNPPGRIDIECSLRARP